SVALKYRLGNASRLRMAFLLSHWRWRWQRQFQLPRIGCAFHWGCPQLDKAGQGIVKIINVPPMGCRCLRSGAKIRRRLRWLMPQAPFFVTVLERWRLNVGVN